MAVKSQFPLFAPPSLRPDPLRTATEIRFSRWNNAAAQKIIRHERTQKELEDQIRFDRRFDSALTIAHNFNPAPPHPTTFRSTGTPSSPSSPSIPGKKSKYSKVSKQQQSSPKSLHPAFEPLSGPRKLPAKADNPQTPAEAPNFRIDDNGVSYEMPDAPFLYQYSYTETPKVKPLKLREPLVSPFGPATMAKPWLGRKPFPPSKKKLPEFDSFQLPPPNKKGVKPVQAPGPFLAGSGPKYVKSREEILGAPLTKEEIEDLVNGSKKSNRQLNMGRDGLTHNMLDNIHALWKRRRVCKIKCKGVCTVDMKNVCQQLEEKTGGKIIFNRGGVVYLFRGRNYNFKSRPRYPLMLWKPITPVYPRLIKRVPDALTLEEASVMRRKGRDLIPICKLGKNGVYCDLVKNVREAFEACELVRINCQGLNPSDYKKIGAKLKDLVPCVLLSFELEHILMWRGRDWKFTLMGSDDSSKGLQKVDDGAEQLVTSPSPNPQSLSSVDGLETSSSPTCRNEELHSSEETEVSGEPSDADAVAGATALEVNNVSSAASQAAPSNVDGGASVAPDFNGNISAVNRIVDGEILPYGLEESQTRLENTESSPTVPNLSSPQLPEQLTDSESDNPQPHWPSSNSNGENVHQVVTSSIPADSGILLLRNQAVESGMALILDNYSLDASVIFRKAVAFSKTAPSGPVFHYRTKKSTHKSKEQESNSTGPEEAPTGLPAEIEAPSRRDKTKIYRNNRLEDIKAEYLNVAPKGGLRVDELAKLLA